MLSVYEIGDIFVFGCGYIVQIRGSRHQHVNGVYHICWNEGLKAYIFQRKVLEWGGGGGVHATGRRISYCS